MDVRRVLLYISIMRWNHLAAGISCSTPPAYYQCEPGWRWKHSRFVDFDLWIVLDGEGGVNVSGREHALSRGTGLLFFPGDSVEAWHNPKKPFRVFAAHFLVANASYRSLLRKTMPEPLRYHDTAKCEARAMELIQHPDSSGIAELRIAQLLAQAATDAQVATPDPVNEKLKKLTLEMTANPAADWDPVLLAKRAGLSLPQFNRRFRALTGKSPIRYLIMRRIDRARKLLAETPLSLGEIADALGYSDIFYFHRQFRAETGQTPGAIRRPG